MSTLSVSSSKPVSRKSLGWWRCTIGIACLIPLLSQAAAAPVSGIITWLSPEAGLKESKRTGKPILYYFWAPNCAPCRRLNAEVFENAEYAERIQRDFVCVSGTYRYYKKFKMRGNPSLVVKKPGTKRYRRMTGYGGAQSVMDFLEKAK